MRRRWRRLATGMACAWAALLVFVSMSLAFPFETDSEDIWPDTEAVKPNLRVVKELVKFLEEEVDLMELSAANYADWETCLRGVQISEYGDTDGKQGYLYDEVDGTGLGFNAALTRDRTSRPRKEDYLFFDFERGNDCFSPSTKSGGTGEEARVQPGGGPRVGPGRPLAAVMGRALADVPSQPFAARLTRLLTGERRRPPARPTRRRPINKVLTNLERRVVEMVRATFRLEDSSERFDEWESCVSAVPVTQLGDPEGKFGYLFGSGPGSKLEYRAALEIDRTEWEDPEYNYLAYVGGDRPGRQCQDEPGEAVD